MIPSQFQWVLALCLASFRVYSKEVEKEFPRMEFSSNLEQEEFRKALVTQIIKQAGPKCLNDLRAGKDLVQFFKCFAASNPHRRFPKQEDDDDPDTLFPVPPQVPQVIGLLTEAFTGLNQAVNSSSGQPNLPNWLFSGLTNLFGSVTGVKPPSSAPTPPTYYPVPPARPNRPGGTYPPNSISAGQRLRRTTTVVPPRRKNTSPRSTSTTTSTPEEPEGESSSAAVEEVTIKRIKETTTLPTRLGPLLPDPGTNLAGGSGQFFPAPPRRTKPKPLTTLAPSTTLPPTTTLIAEPAPQEKDIETESTTMSPPVDEDTEVASTTVPPPLDEDTTQGFHNDLLNAFAQALNRFKEPSSTSTPSPASSVPLVTSTEAETTKTSAEPPRSPTETFELLPISVVSPPMAPVPLIPVPAFSNLIADKPFSFPTSPLLSVVGLPQSPSIESIMYPNRVPPKPLSLPKPPSDNRLVTESSVSLTENEAMKQMVSYEKFPFLSTSTPIPGHRGPVIIHNTFYPEYVAPPSGVYII